MLLEELEGAIIKGVTVKVKTLLEALDNKTLDEVEFMGVDFTQSISNCTFSKCVFANVNLPCASKTTFTPDLANHVTSTSAQIVSHIDNEV